MEYETQNKLPQSQYSQNQQPTHVGDSNPQADKSALVTYASARVSKTKLFIAVIL